MYPSLHPTLDYPPEPVPNTKEWIPYLSMLRKSSVGWYDPIADRVSTNNSVCNRLSNPKQKNDLSWLPKGELEKKQRECKIEDASKTIQYYWNKKQDRRHPFLIKHYKNPPSYESNNFTIRSKCK